MSSDSLQNAVTAFCKLSEDILVKNDNVQTHVSVQMAFCKLSENILEKNDNVQTHVSVEMTRLIIVFVCFS